MISFLAEQIETGATSARILVTAHTNAAVDRVLVGLLDTGFTGATLQPQSPLHRMHWQMDLAWQICCHHVELASPKH